MRRAIRFLVIGPLFFMVALIEWVFVGRREGFREVWQFIKHGNIDIE